MASIKIAVDAGHGYNTRGKRTPPLPCAIDWDMDGIIDVKKGQSIREHVACVGVARELEKELLRNGFDVIKTGWEDENPFNDVDITIANRQKKIRNNHCKYSISIHFGISGTGYTFNEEEGFFICYHNQYQEQSKQLAKQMESNLSNNNTQTNHGIMECDSGIVNCKKLKTTASIAVYLAYMTNENEAVNCVGNQSFWVESAKRICCAFCAMEGKNYDRGKDEGIEKKETIMICGGILNCSKQIYRLPVKESQPIIEYPKDTIIYVTKNISECCYQIQCKESKQGIGYVFLEQPEEIQFVPVYRTKRWDSMWSIARDQMGKGSKFLELQAFNHVTKPVPPLGSVLLLPVSK